MMGTSWEKAARGAGAAALVSAALAIWAGARAAELEPLPGPARSAPVRRAGAVAPRQTYPAEVIVAAALEDPFRPVPPTAPAAAITPLEAPPPAPGTADPGAVRLVGTMQFPDGRAAAVCRLGSEPARLVRVGERIGAYTLARVEPGRAILTGPTGRLELTVLKPGA